VFQLLPFPLVRTYALWFGVFLVIQSFLTPLLDNRDFFHHIPNLTRIVDAKAAEAIGGTGPQRITIDERGFRVFPSVDYSRRTDLRIFAIGGSTTDEGNINDQETWTHRVQLALANEFSQRVEVINTGVAGLLTPHHLATLRYVLGLHPNIAIFLIGANDWNFDIREEFGANASSRRLAFRDTPLAQLATAAFHRAVRETAFGPGSIRQGGSLRRERKIAWFPEKASDRYIADLARIGNVCHEARLTCVFLTQPSGYRPNAAEALKDKFWMSPPDASYTLTFESLVHVAEVYNQALINFGKENGFDVCDLAPRIEPTVENFFDDFHFTFKGSERVAAAVADCLRRSAPSR
jgi:lysophospholipase L1-like esterase